MSSSGLNNGDFSRLDVAYDLGVGTNRNTGIAGQVLTSGGSAKSMSWGSTGVSEVNAGDGIIVDETTNPAGDKEKTIKTHIDNDTITYKNGSPTKIFQVAKVPQSLTAGTGISFSTGSTYDGSTAITISAQTPIVVNQLKDDTQGRTWEAGTTATLLTGAQLLTTKMYGITGWGIENLTATSQQYLIEVDFDIGTQPYANNPFGLTSGYLRLDSSASSDTSGWGASNGIVRVTTLSTNTSSILPKTGEFWTGRVHYNFVITNLTIGNQYDFIPRFLVYRSAQASGFFKSLAIRYGLDRRAYVKATPIPALHSPTTNTGTDGTAQTEDDFYEQGGGGGGGV
jgi:hypothetical protein